ncbi:hypothetical protein Pmar_PMAR008906 [Perkinsus marinus ATCC 50983]|uniref:Uncharacterized protein n=1 Tax=Perkinsus marinus (strain ATCC 50983 / TXsc) TaxID=423536 RepID=C5KAB5_PERM5|nr:hypothetical protein Pmar_PMAR008906 [Perkinsus marinus ATCC 50983]EER18576.1 hypothetical protein Pmar_PMAR008906 [Perkinsus marinus ATCC 50983]|eukprot:XP_002786780.1 hypothetical protein Pmar_PMAR008906 [Perkinsus marinus ATCC 50983]
MVSLLAILALGAVWCTGAFPSGAYHKKLANDICIQIDALEDLTIREYVLCAQSGAVIHLGVTGSNPYTVAPSSQKDYDDFYKFLISQCGDALKSKGMHEFTYDQANDTIKTTFQSSPQVLQRGNCWDNGF